MIYYGTDLNSAGHYFWELEGNSIHSTRFRHNDCPFNPEALPCSEAGVYLPNGYVKYYNFAGFTICAIQGSCYDHRPGSKTIFFIKESLTTTEMKGRIFSIPIAVKIIKQMKFEVNL